MATDQHPPCHSFAKKVERGVLRGLHQTILTLSRNTEDIYFSPNEPRSRWIFCCDGNYIRYDHHVNACIWLADLMVSALEHIDPVVYYHTHRHQDDELGRRFFLLSRCRRHDLTMICSYLDPSSAIDSSDIVELCPLSILFFRRLMKLAFTCTERHIRSWFEKHRPDAWATQRNAIIDAIALLCRNHRKHWKALLDGLSTNYTIDHDVDMCVSCTY